MICEAHTEIQLSHLFDWLNNVAPFKKLEGITPGICFEEGTVILK